ncbi:hypothetical protein [Thermoanaerobacterium thermosaccharolyticum]|uniref:Uncharacterized protein n=1 Tax=Thermoanaerobacterium thermosaccharolyticum (strain ATCC 7956 / DSM 571 / NCIMB 9385 / NCA 3814 / NCTC 13789 / WDCM 00135 / 2032) TaxID=580327 RepID=D9TQ67_THETC|nr:hypothetical protein [Thermoanaerobacterium thermosaccharolyticum]ADL67854.1 conserved hypothetical protein [Thermoanaerobacterium thermosaccharolyticum DSM 571]TCW42580.1 hypothetical protein EDC21_101196 [Thermohydrogenium kirishiense]
MERRNRSAALASRIIPYHPEYRKITGSVTAAILFEQLEYWFDKYGYNYFYKFLEPAPNHFSYKEGDSWIEELGFSIDEFRSAFDKIGVRYGSRNEFLKAKEEGRLFIKNGEEKLYCSFIDKQKNVTYYVRNNELVDMLLDEINHKEVENDGEFIKPKVENEKALYPDMPISRDGKSPSPGDGKSPSPEVGKTYLPYINRLHQDITHKNTSINHSEEMDGRILKNQSKSLDDDVIGELKNKYMLSDDDIKTCIERMKGRDIRSPINFLEKTIENYIKEKSIRRAVDNVKSSNGASYAVPRNYFNGYSQRKYSSDDIEELEKMLLEKSRVKSEEKFGGDEIAKENDSFLECKWKHRENDFGNSFCSGIEEIQDKYSSS